MEKPYIDPKINIEPNRPVIALFSSGTTGPPKGIVHALRYFTAHMGPLPQEPGMALSHRPMQYGASLTAAVNAILRGMQLEILTPDAGPYQIWERLRQGGVTNLAGSVGFWVGLMEYFEQNLDGLPEEAKMPYTDGVRSLRVANCSGAMAMPTTKRFWKSMRGQPLQMVWGSTESSIGLKTGSDLDFIDSNAIGKPISNVEVKLSEGDHGEMKVKTPTMFLRYWNNERATREAFDEEGFYRTGDLVHRVDGDYIIQGRAATDIINCAGVKTPILDVETGLSKLEYISEACVLPVKDPKTGNRVAALVRTRLDRSQLTLQVLRKDLASHLPAFQLPTVLRVLGDQEHIPRTISGKVARQEANTLYFPQNAVDPSLENLPQEVQLDNFDPKAQLRSRRMWDTGGVQ
ncbi:hypothetical protein N7481_001208 [Penicillium waksmanii]|uniref:uncharacterized protein n=1 Tax=Penicillium waksmanii TaxID=69791 RepID=UPI0025488EFF|nr:uncharacterized protein N7481_001208 [Penicillium waksmanii]KAJ6000799.1 hypothetical protein N7481_001208 [Penicillium waksmanii]